MEGQWPQEKSDVHTELDLAMASPGEYNDVMLDDLVGDDLDEFLGLGADTNMGNSTGDASAAAAEQDNENADERSEEWSKKRHNKDQVLELELAFMVNQHPDEKQRTELGSRLGITAQQVKFWFQNRRSSYKTQEKRKETSDLREVNEALKDEQRALRSATENNSCLACRGPTVRVGGTRQVLLSENARLKEGLQQVIAFLKSVSCGRAPELMAGAIPSGSINGNIGAGKGKALATDHALPPPQSHRALSAPVALANNVGFACSPRETCIMLVDLATRASLEYRILLYSGTQMWMPSADGEVELLNFQTYIETIFPSFFGPYREGVVVDGTRKTGDVRGTTDNLVGALMDAAQWSGMFPGIVASARASRIFTPRNGSRHEMTILMDAELRLLSPRVPLRKIKFIRQCRKVGSDDTWVVVDVSVDGIHRQGGSGAPPTWTASRLLPSGCIIQGRSDGCCKVTWIVNMEHDKTTVPQMYHPLLSSGQALGACRWLASLKRQCEYLAIMHSLGNTADMTPNGPINIFGVAQRMTRSFYQAMCGPWSQPCRSLDDWSGGCGEGVERFEVVARVVTYSAASGSPGEQAGAVVLNVTAPVWLFGIPPQQVLDYLCDVSRRSEWDSLADGAPVVQEGYFATGHLPGNSVSVLRTTANGKLILQEACADTTCMVLAYAVTDEEAIQHAMNNGGAASLSLLPSGLVILPDGASPIPAACSSSTGVSLVSNTGSLVSVMYQTVLNGQAPEEPSLEAIDNARNLLCRVIKKIKDAVHANIVVTA